MTHLEKSIIQTLAFFDIFRYPLTLDELYKWLWKPPRNLKLSDLKEVLETSQFLKEKISVLEGFYILKGREHTYLIRKHNNNLAERKFRRAIWLTKIYRFFPFVKMVAICNSLAYSNAGESSDIDLFIISQRKMIWLTRFFTVLVTRILGLRPTPSNKKDTFCLSFYIDEDYLEIKNTMLKNDIYYPYWVAQLMPIYDPHGLYKKFLQANDWHQDFLPYSYPNQFSKEVKLDLKSKILGRIIAWLAMPPILGRGFYVFYRKVQSNIIDQNLKSLINVDTRVIVNDYMLKFYSNDNREMFYQKWRDKLEELLPKNG